MKEIKITDIENIKIGNAQNIEKGSGCTVIVCEKGASCGVEISGGGPASRETFLLNPMAAAEKINAVLLSGGSAFGLDAAGGVMQYLEENDIGFDTGITKVPLVCASSIFDLVVGDMRFRPDKEMGYEAAKNALEKSNYTDGNFGAGTGATVGKFLGTQYMMKSGIGSYAVSLGDLKVGAVVCVNALGDVFENGKIIAGMLSCDKKSFADTAKTMYESNEVRENLFTSNTTIACVITNAAFDKSKMNKIAKMAHNAYALSIKPVNTTADGDSVYAMSAGDVNADINVVGMLAADVLEKAIVCAVKSAKSAYGLIAYNDMIEMR